MKQFQSFQENVDCYENVCGHRALYVLAASLSLSVITGLLFTILL